MNNFLSRSALFSSLLMVGLGTSAQTVQMEEQSDSIELSIADVLDSISSQKMFEAAFNRPIFNKNNKYKFAEDSVPSYSDNVYEARLAKLDAASPCDLVFNAHVKSYINLYTVRKRESVSRMLGMAQLYYPMFEEVMDKYDIPLELKHLAVIESALVPTARSRVGATGLWQFMYPTGKMYGLKVTSYIDDRCDPYKATVAAAEYLKNLYDMFGDWQMVLAAYNAGPGTISKAIRRSGGKRTYWEIRPWLPRETQGYVPAFIAANYVMNYAAEHNIYPSLPHKNYFEVDTIVVRHPMTFEQLSKTIEISTEQLCYFNPQYRKNVIPSGGNAICLPKDKIAYFLENEKEIYAALQEQLQSGEVSVVAEVKKIHVVRSGEMLSTVARKYGVTIADLRSWNSIGRAVKPGQRLTVYVREQTASKNGGTQLAAKKNNDEKLVAENRNSSAQFTSYRVRKGDTLSEIAQRNRMSYTTIMKDNDLRSTSLREGQVLRIRK